MADQGRLRIGLLGQFGIGNLGNEGSLAALLAFLRARAPEAELICICSDPAYVRQAHGVEAAPLWAPGRLGNLVHALRTVRGLDVLFIPGTGILDDFGERPSGLPYDLWRWCWAARFAGAKVGFVSIGAGPIVSKASRFLMLGAASAAAYRSYRDLPSKRFMNIPQDPVFPDLAFGLPAPKRSARSDATPTVALGVMAYYGWSGTREEGERTYRTYIGKIAAYTAWLISQGIRVKFVIGKDKDVAAVETVRAVFDKTPSPLLAPFEPAENLGDVMAQIGGADIAVVTRFHNLVCALKVGCPTISLSYAEKNDALMAEMGLEEFCQHVESFDLEKLKAQTQRLLAEKDARRAVIERKVADYVMQLAEQERLLAEEFLGAAPSIGVAGPALVNA